MDVMVVVMLVVMVVSVDIKRSMLMEVLVSVMVVLVSTMVVLVGWCGVCRGEDGDGGW